MIPGVGVWRCTACSTLFFPRRLLCARCHAPGFEETRVFEARVEEITTIRHVLGQADWQPKRLANVRTPEGLYMTVGLLDGAVEGDRIALCQEGTAPFGRRNAEEAA